jgi:hypothetical protein
MATTFGFSALHGPHHEAQKSTMVTFPKLCFREISFPWGFGAEKSDLQLAGAGAGAGAIFDSLIFNSMAFPGFVVFKDASKLAYNPSTFLMSTAGSFIILCIIKAVINDLGCVSE